MPNAPPWAIVSKRRTPKTRHCTLRATETVTPSPSESPLRTAWNLDLTSTSILNFSADDDDASIPPAIPPSDDPDPDSDSDFSFSMTTADPFPPGRFVELMRPLLDGPPPSLSNPTKDAHDTIRYNLGTALSRVLLTLKDASNASFITDSPDFWNLRHGTTDDPKPVPSLPDKPVEPSEYDSKYKWRKYTTDLRDYTVCKQACDQILLWMDKVYDGLLDDKKIRDAFPLNFTPQQAFEHIETISNFKLTANSRSTALETQLGAPYDPIAGPQKYFKQLKDTQTAIGSLGRVYTVTDMRLIVTATAAFTAYFGEGSSDFSSSLKKWNEQEERMQGNADYETTVFPAFQKYWIDELKRLQICAPVRANLMEIAEDTAVSAAKTNELEHTIAGLQAKITCLEQRANATPTDEASVLSAITDPAFIQAFAALTNPTASTTVTPPPPPRKNRRDDRNQLSSEERGRLHVEKMKRVYGPKGRPYKLYCWGCGLTFNHKTGRCKALSTDEKRKYAAATFANTMGGSTENFDRVGKHEGDFDPRF